MKTFPRLFKRTKTSAIVYYSIHVDAGDTDHAPIIVKESGQLNTKSPMLYRETIHEGKQKRSPLEQAIFMAESDWLRKKDGGYKSLDDLNIIEKGTGGVQDGAGNHIQTLELALDLALPQFNSGISGQVLPMLATDWAKVKDIPYPVIVQPKLDGVRCLMIAGYKGDTWDLTFLSRSGKNYTSLDHIAFSVANKYYGAQSMPSFILDGEIYSEELSFQEIVSAVKALKETSKQLKFRAYDIVSDENQSVRLAKLRMLVKDIDSEHITEVPWTVANNAADVKDLHDMHVINGYEGAMIRFTEGKYGQGQRSRELLKVKQFDETEFTFIRFEIGQRDEDLIAVCSMPTTGICFKAKVVGTREEKVKLQSIPEEQLEYKKYTVKHFGYTDDGLPRFPIGKSFRDY